MAEQAQQNSCIDIENSKSLTHSIQPVTIEQRKLTCRHSDPDKEVSAKLQSISVDIPKNNETETESQQNKLIKKQEQNVEANDIYKEHRLFLEKYKKEREMRESKISKNNHWQLEEEDEDEEVREEDTKFEAYRQVVKQKMQRIHARIHKQLLSYRYDDDRPKYKLFTEVIETKNDIQRVSKQKRFLRSQQCRYLDYQQPQMTLQSKLPLQYRIKSHSFHDELELCRKAKGFIHRMHNEQENLLGKQIIRKRREQFKKYHEQKKQLQKIQQFNEIMKQQRKLKAQQNLLLSQQKQRINQIINKKSLDQLRKMLQDKEAKLQEIRESLKENYKKNDYRSKRGSIQNNRKRVRTSVNDYTYLEEEHQKGSIQTNGEKSREERKQTKGIRSKLAVKRYRLSRPTEYETGYPENDFLDKIVEKSYKKSQKRQHTESIAQYTKSQLSDRNEEGRSQIPISHHNYTEYVDDDTFGMVLPKQKIVNIQNK